MAKASEQPLQPNPFRTYRDPKTGLWIVIPFPDTESRFYVSHGQKISSNSNEVL
ncbi:hypothetical protein [Crocosphaera sp.]|uniref:hypothetical protein n=1 Tax=Crocosphaera sp. TaxID=2729996 RepID=UPI002611CE3E|nr:hypothetical protein [Crocosphaera sp.]MDJ0580495.1 hypothetical protein [Crocosphaera sp.]